MEGLAGSIFEGSAGCSTIFKKNIAADASDSCKKKKTLASYFFHFFSAMPKTSHKPLQISGKHDTSRPAEPPSSQAGDGREPAAPPVLALIGGFLGAGKTTFIGGLVRRLQARGLRCAVVSNDQSVGLVDSTSARLLDGAAVAEVTGACFCCKLDDLVAAVARLQRDERPDVILCEPVGSCTDLVATVILPLERIYQTGVRLAPFTVLLDARRAMTTFGGTRRKKDFAKDVGYIFRKQVEEADGLFINKAELLGEGEREKLQAALASAFPGKPVGFGSAKSGAGVEEWMGSWLGGGDAGGTEQHAALAGAPAMRSGETPDLQHLQHRRDGRAPLKIDYAVYARGEAMLGWYNARLGLQAAAPLDGNAWLLDMAKTLAAKLEEEGLEVAHFKAALRQTQDCKTQDAREEDTVHALAIGGSEVAIVNQVLSGEDPALSRRMNGRVTAGELLVNLRAEGDAGGLKAIVREVLEGDARVALVWHAEAAFQPGEPKPTHRMTAAGGSWVTGQ
jgi:G3E family GTPase